MSTAVRPVPKFQTVLTASNRHGSERSEQSPFAFFVVLFGFSAFVCLCAVGLMETLEKHVIPKSAHEVCIEKNTVSPWLPSSPSSPLKRQLPTALDLEIACGSCQSQNDWLLRVSSIIIIYLHAGCSCSLTKRVATQQPQSKSTQLNS